MRIKVLLAAFLLSLGLFATNAQAVKYWGDTLLTDEAVDFKEQASSPTNPSTDRWKLYFKSDGSVYKLDESGVETELASKGSEIQDSDGDTKVQTEEGADDDTIRFDAAGSEVGTWTSSLFTTTTPLTVGGEVKTTGIEDSDGDTSVKVEESADEDIIRFDVLGSQAGRIDTTGWMLKGNDVSGDGPLHIGAGLAGSVTANGEADDMVVEGTTRAGYSMLVEDGGIAKILAGSPSNGSNYGGLQFHGAGSSLRFRVAGDEKINLSDAEFRVNYGGGTPESTFDLRVDGGSLNYVFFVDSGQDNAAFGTNSPDASALLDMVSTTKGLGLPSQTTTERDAISTPRDGLMVYDETTDQVSVRANGAWENLVTSAGSGAMDCETAQATTSGTSVDFTSLPSSIRRVTVIGRDMSLSATDNLEIQLGDAGGIETSSYNSNSEDGSGNTTSTSGFVVKFNAAAAVINFVMEIVRIDGDEWVEKHTGGREGSGFRAGSGDKTLSAELTQLKIRPGGSDSFDGGKVNVCHEQ